MASRVAIGDFKAFSFGSFTLVPERQLLLRHEAPLRIGGRALELLTVLVQRQGELVSKEELIARVWPDTKVAEGNLKVNMAMLRRVLEDGPSTPYIKTVVNRGYQFVAAVRASAHLQLPADATAKVMPSHNLPISTMRTFGRADAITNIRRDLEQARLISIVGAGGVGKTTVAIAVAERALPAFPGGVWFVDLAPVADGERVAHAVAATLGVQSHAPDILAVVGEQLRDRQALLVLDNCEQVTDAVAACADRLLASAKGVRVLATSREPLRMADERVARLPGLESPAESPSLDARSALQFPAVQLFVERATDAYESFQLGDADAPLVARICRSLDGLALAIQLAATRVESFGVAGVLRQLEERARLVGGWRTGPERQRTLAATLDWSYALLDERDASVLRATSVFAVSFYVEAAAAVCARSFSEVFESLANLAAKSLLTLEPVGDGIRCRLLETTRAYAGVQLQDSGEESGVRKRHAEYICAVLERATAEWSERPAREWGAEHGSLVDDLRAAIAWSSTDEASRTLFIRLTVAGLRLWNHLSLNDESRATVARAIEQLGPAGLAGTAIEMQLQMSLADAMMFTRGPSPEVFTALQRTLHIADALDDVDHRLRALRTMGCYKAFLGEQEVGRATLQKFVRLAAEQDPSALPDGETHLGITEVFTGRLAQARQRLERLQRDSSPTVDDSQLARFHYHRKVDIGNVLSYAEWLTGSPDTAARTAAATVEHALELQHGLSLTNALAVAACPVFFMSRRYEECAPYVSMLDREVRKQGVVVWSPTARFFRGALACAQDAVPESGIAELEQAVAEFRAMNHGARRPWILAVLADALTRAGHVEDAESVSNEALAGANNERWCEAEVLRIHARVRSAQGRPEEAEALLLQAIDSARDTEALSWRLRAAVDLAQLWHARSRTEEARALLAPTYAEFTEGFATRDLVEAAELLARCGGGPKA